MFVLYKMDVKHLSINVAIEYRKNLNLIKLIGFWEIKLTKSEHSIVAACLTDFYSGQRNWTNEFQKSSSFDV